MDKGHLGEAIAADYLVQKGWELLHKNWRAGIHEIDLIARDREELVFVEVRCLSAAVPWQPEATITRRKQERLRRAAAAFYSRCPQWEALPARIDVIAVRLTRPPEIWHIVDAFR